MNITIREKNNSYQVILSYKKNGKWKQKTKQGFSKQKDAKKWAEDLSLTIMEDRKDGIENTDITVKEALEIYIEYQKNSIRPGSVKNTIDVKRIFYKDTLSYFGINLDNKVTQWFCRLVLKENLKYIIIRTEKEENEKITLESVDDLYNLKDKLIASIEVMVK